MTFLFGFLLLLLHLASLHCLLSMRDVLLCARQFYSRQGLASPTIRIREEANSFRLTFEASLVSTNLNRRPSPVHLSLCRQIPLILFPARFVDYQELAPTLCQEDFTDPAAIQLPGFHDDAPQVRLRLLWPNFRSSSSKFIMMLSVLSKFCSILATTALSCAVHPLLYSQKSSSSFLVLRVQRLHQMLRTVEGFSFRCKESSSILNV